MQSRALLSFLWSFLLLAFVAAQSASSPDATAPSTTAPTTSAAGSQAPPTGGSSTGGGASPTQTGGGSKPSSDLGPPDVLLQVPELHVGRIELIVDNLQAELNLGAQVASLVEINAGVQVGIKKVNITIAEVDANVELVIRLGNLVDIVNRTLASLDLNPLLINVLDTAVDVVNSVVGAVDGLLGSIVNGDSKINFLIDNLGNIVQEVAGDAGKIVSSIIGNYDQNMTYTGAQKILEGGNIQKTYKYDALGSLVNVITNAAGQVVQAVVVGKDGSGGTTSSTVSSKPTATPAARRR
ncbi:hypothetical protein PG996_011348 [Apiospora saccharicola]|uniref:Uncharacterized protein n=1 Tax=Apiospora saccharicola TaxID=335842 RepID=A0ABR1UH28_9PEZI